MPSRNYKYLDEQAIDRNGPEPDDDPLEVLYDSLLDILQLAEEEGFLNEEIDSVLRRVIAFRSDRQNADGTGGR